MTLRACKRTIWLVNALLVGAIAATVWFALTPPALEGATDPPGDGGDGNRPAAGAASAEPVERYAVLHRRPLRRPLYDPKPVVVKVERKPPRPFPATLTGTAVDPTFTAAFFQTRRGRTEMVAVGQKIEGAEVLRIGPDSAVIRWHGEEKTVKVAGEGR
jgi:hypothetical protein